MPSQTNAAIVGHKFSTISSLDAKIKLGTERTECFGPFFQEGPKLSFQIPQQNSKRKHPDEDRSFFRSSSTSLQRRLPLHRVVPNGLRT